MYEDLKEDCISEIGIENFKKVDKILELFDSEPFEDLEQDGITVSCCTEKLHQLQENVCVSIYNDDFEVELLYENGINNGTQLNDYSINPTKSFTRASREYEIVTGVELDMDQIKQWEKATGKKCSIQKAQILLDRHKPEIMKLIKDQNYDNYVTGGGTNKTDSYYRKKKDELKDMGVFWKVITKTEETIADFI